jgi:hypothetical protein
MDFYETGVEEYRIELSGDTLIVHNTGIKYKYERQ